MKKKHIASFAFALACTVALPSWGQTSLPEGNAKPIVESVCTRCHDLGRITNSGGHSEEGWRNVVAMMMNAGAPLPKEKAPEVIEYLARNFPEQPRPKAVLLPGPAKVTIHEWPVPTPGTRPHDTAAAPDGSIWYAGQMANVVGRLDPATGDIKEYHSTTEHSGPHGIVADKDGNIWFTANFKGYIGKLNPRTGEFVQFPMPDRAARDPHTLIFDQKGILWFTVQNANFVGRLDPQTGEVRLVKVPTPKGRPYGIAVNSKGVPFFVEFGSNKIASIDPATLAIHEYTLPAEGARPRRLAIDDNDVIWYTDYERGYLGRFDPKTGKASEWLSPGGPKSAPYAIAFSNAMIWYSESGVSPNTIVGFNPKTQKFQSVAIPSGGGVVRNMMAEQNGNLVFACSGENRIALAEIRR